LSVVNRIPVVDVAVVAAVFSHPGCVYDAVIVDDVGGSFALLVLESFYVYVSNWT